MTLAKIYKIEPIIEHDEGDVYFGFTTLKYLSNRFSKHKYAFNKNCKNQTSASKLFNKYGVENCCCLLVEEININDVKEKEKYYILNNKCVNKIIPDRTIKEWYIDNKERLLEYRKQYYINNKEKCIKQNKEYKQKQKKINLDL